MSLTKATYSMIDGAPVNVLDYGAIANDSQDCTESIQAALNAATASKKSVYFPSGTYKITDTLTISDEIKIYGDGNQSSILKLYTASTDTFALSCVLSDNASVIGLDIGYIGITCNGGAAKGRGIYLATTATNSAISQSAVHDIYIRNATVGISLYGVIYMCDFSNITVVGADVYGWRANPISGQILYNRFADLEVTNVAATAYAYYMESPSCHFKNLTADGCCYFSGAYITIDGISVEGISAASVPSAYAIHGVQIQSIRNIDVINVPNSKCAYAVAIESPNFSLSGLRVPDAGAGNQPGRALALFAGNTGTISDVHYDLAITQKLEAYLSDSILNNFVFTGCSDITDRGLVYAQGAWTPSFATWSTSPSVSAARYVRVGNQVTVFINANGGVCADYSTITGLPFTSSANVGGTAQMASGDIAKRFAATINTSSTIINNIPAQSLTGPIFWTLSATYHC